MITVGTARYDQAIIRAASLQPTDPKIIAAIDRGQRFIVGHGNFADTEQEYCFNIRNGCIFVPPEVKAIVDVQLLGSHSQMFGQAFFYLDNGPRSTRTAGLGLVDRGPTTVFAQPECPTGLMLIADACENQNPVPWIDIVAKDEYDRPIITEDQNTKVKYSSIRLPIVNGKVFKYPVANVTTIESITKPVTLGAIHLFQYNPANDSAGPLIASLAPYDITPSWRRYEVTGGPMSGQVRVLAKRRHMPLYSDNQTLMIDDLEATGYAIMHLNALDGRDFEGAKEYLEALNRRLQSRENELHRNDERRVEFDMPTRFNTFPRLR